MIPQAEAKRNPPVFPESGTFYAILPTGQKFELFFMSRYQIPALQIVFRVLLYMRQNL
jgi:hypothetical protein